MFTSCFGRMKLIRPPLYPVAITRGVPEWFTGKVEQRLAPTWAMLRGIPAEEYDRLFATILAQLDPQAMWNELGENAVLLCYEKPGERCHRRMVAAWFESALKVEVPELLIPQPTTQPTLFDDV